MLVSRIKSCPQYKALVILVGHFCPLSNTECRCHFLEGTMGMKTDKMTTDPSKSLILSYETKVFTNENIVLELKILILEVHHKRSLDLQLDNTEEQDSQGGYQEVRINYEEEHKIGLSPYEKPPERVTNLLLTMGWAWTHLYTILQDNIDCQTG
jgi:hypothetical protein